jgi:hypothetical protein
MTKEELEDLLRDPSQDVTGQLLELSKDYLNKIELSNEFGLRVDPVDYSNVFRIFLSDLDENLPEFEFLDKCYFPTYYWGVTEIISQILSWVNENELDLNHPLIKDLIESIQLRIDFEILADTHDWLYDLETTSSEDYRLYKINSETTEIPTYDDELSDETNTTNLLNYLRVVDLPHLTILEKLDEFGITRETLDEMKPQYMTFNSKNKQSLLLFISSPTWDSDLLSDTDTSEENDE